MAKRKEEEPPKGAPAWQSTFADLMNLLLCFFVMLFAMSTIDAEKFALVAASFSQTFSIFDSGGSSLLEVGDEVKTALSEKLNDYGIYIEKFNIVNFDFSSEYNEAIEAKQVAEQNLLKTQTEQEQAIVIANAEAEKKKIAANATAEALLTEAQAQADANKLLEESLSEKVIAYEQIQKWNGVMPKVTSGDSNGLLINIDLDDLDSSSGSQSSGTAVSIGE